MNDRTAPDMRILKIEICPSLSGRTSITYHLGCLDAQRVSLRIWKTSGKGVYSKEWISTSDIKKVLDKHESISAPLLLPLFHAGRSVNSAGFLLAALKHERLVSASPDVAHRYVRAGDKTFKAAVDALIASGAALDPEVSAPPVHAPRKKARGVASAPPWQANPKSQLDEGV